MSRLVAGRRSPEVPAAFPVERLPVSCSRTVSTVRGFFCRIRSRSRRRCLNTRRQGLRSGAKCPGACHGIRPGASGALWRGCCPSCIVPLSHRKVWGLPIALPGGAAGGRPGMSDRRIAVVRPLSRSHRPAGIPVTLLTDAPRYQAVPPVAGGKGLRPRGRGSADPALVGVGLAFLRRLNPFVVGGVERVHSRWVRRADRREGRGGDTRAPQR